MADETTKSKCFKDLTGQKFGRWTVKSWVGWRHLKWGKRSLWLAVCDCGTEKIVTGSGFYDSKSCGCYRKERSTTHGRSFQKRGDKNASVYNTWRCMTQRVTNPKARWYSCYGGRGIKIDPAWKSFEQFLLDVGEKPSPNHSLDRIDTDKDYCKENCRWATAKEQNWNMRKNVMVEYNGETLCLGEWEYRLGLGKGCLRQRLKRGWSTEKAMTEPVQMKKPYEKRRAASICKTGK